MPSVVISLKSIVLWLCLCIPPVAYYVYLAMYSLDVPNADDFIVIVHYLIKSDNTTSWPEKWHTLTFEFLEHRLVFTRLMAQFFRALFGYLDLRLIMFAGNLSLLGVAGLLYRLLRLNGFSSWYILPVMLCLFQPIAYESHFWAISSTNYMPVCLFAMLSFYGISRGDRPGLTGAWIMGLVATYTFANGLVVWPIGLLMLCLKQRWQLAIIWLISILFIVWAYYYGHSYHLHPSMADNVRERLPMVIANFFLLLGAVFNTQDTWHMINTGDLPAYIVGMITAFVLASTGLILALKAWLPVKMREGVLLPLTRVNHSEFLWATMLFILLSCAAFGAGRSGDGSVASDSRYRDFPVFAMALGYCVVLLGLHPTYKRVWLRLTTIASLFFCLSSYAIYTPRLLDQNARHIAGAYNWHHNGDWLIYRETSYFSEVAISVSRELEEKATDWYQIRNYFAEPPVISPIRLAAPNYLDTKKKVAIWWLPGDPVGSDQPYFWFQSGPNVYLLPIKRPTSLANWLRKGRSLGHSFVTDLQYGRALPPGHYGTSIYLAPSNKRLLFSPDLVLVK